MNLRIMSAERERAVEVRESGGRIAQSQLEHGAVDVRLLEVRSQLDGTGITRQGVLEAAQVAQGIPQVAMRRSHAAIAAEGSLNEFDGTFRLSGLRGKHAAQMQGIEVSGVELQQLAEPTL
jgi:hypothetical protein